MNNDMKLYYDYTISPLGGLFYKSVWSQLGEIKGKKILDFGSAFGHTSNYFAKENEVIAVEKFDDIIYFAKKENSYTQIQDDISYLKNIQDETFDVVFCHLVFEFVENQKAILNELIRVLKKDGFISIVRHNKAGRVIQAVVQDYDLNDAKNLLNGGNSYSSAFRDIKYYENNDLLNWSNNKLHIKDVFGVRVVASLHDSKFQEKENWVEEMFEIESKLFKSQDFISISYFNHLILEKL